MNNLIDLIISIIYLSLCSWGIYCFYISIRLQKFIVKRYEVETDLLDTIYFKEHATITRYAPNFFSSALYTGHLLSFVWGWSYCKKKKPYRDIKDAKDVIEHFSEKEVRQAKWFVISGLIIIIHCIVISIFESIWSEQLG